MQWNAFTTLDLCYQFHCLKCVNSAEEFEDAYVPAHGPMHTYTSIYTETCETQSVAFQ